MKKWMFFFLCFMFLLTGCTGEIRETNPAEPGEFDFDTSDFSCYANISSDCVWDLCPFMDTQLNYMLLTKKPLEPEETVMLMFTNSCEYTGVECAEEWMTEFPFWLYQTYRGVDWDVVADVAAAAQNGDADAQRKLAEYETLYLEDYEALTSADLPPLYGYWVTNNVTTVDYSTGATAAQYEALPLVIGGEELTVDVGLLNVYSQGWDQYLASEEVDEDIYVGRLATACPTYWGDGTVTLAPMVIAKEDHPQSLTSLELYGVESEVLDIRVSFNGTTQNWDGASALTIPAGTSVSVVVTIQTQANQVVGYCEDANIMVQRDMNGLTQRLWYFVSISQSWNIYELYAMMVDGLDISSYYAYSAQWEQPTGIREPQSNTISFETVTVADTEDYSLYVTGASWDDHAYTLYISAANHTEQALDLNLGNVYLNDRSFDREYTIHLEPGESGEFVWRIAWETMEEYGIRAQTGEDILSIEFIFDPMYNGMLPTDENGYFIINEEYTCIHPMGTDRIPDTSVQGTVVLETDELRLYTVHFDLQPYSCLSQISRPSAYAISLDIENLSDSTISYIASDFRLDGIAVDGIDAGTFRAESYKFSTVPLYLTEMSMDRIGIPETLTFTLTLNGTDTYTVTIDLSQELEG